MREMNPRAWSIDGECWCTRVDYVHLFKGMPQCYEVIGNIHENPELIEKEEE